MTCSTRVDASCAGVLDFGVVLKEVQSTHLGTVKGVVHVFGAAVSQICALASTGAGAAESGSGARRDPGGDWGNIHLGAAEVILAVRVLRTGIWVNTAQGFQVLVM